MGYLIAAGAGLGIGIGFLIWALAERRKRHAAERAADEVRRKLGEAERIAENAASAASMLQAQVERLDSQLAVQRTQLDRTRRLIADRASIAVIEAWLNDEGQAT